MVPALVQSLAATPGEHRQRPWAREISQGGLEGRDWGVLESLGLSAAAGEWGGHGWQPLSACPDPSSPSQGLQGFQGDRGLAGDKGEEVSWLWLAQPWAR